LQHDFWHKHKMKKKKKNAAKGATTATSDPHVEYTSHCHLKG